MNSRVKDILIRAIKTFVQTAGSYLIVNLSGVDFFGENATQAFWTGLLLSAGAAGISAVWNTVIAPATPAE
jgi:anti-anti-sigma regulatory factor